MGRAYGVDNTALIGPDMQLHSEVPVPALAGLLHLGVARRTGVFGRTGSRDDRRIDDGPRAQQKAARFEQAANRVEDRAGQVVLLQQMAKAQDGGLIRHHVVAQLHPREAPHRLTVVDRVLGLRVRKVKPLLQEIDAQHLLQPQRLAAVAWDSAARSTATGGPTESPHPSRPEIARVGSPCPSRSRPSKQTSADYPSPHLPIYPSDVSFVHESINFCRASLVQG